MGWFSKILGVDKRNAKLAAWGQSVPVNPSQRAVMHELWMASKAGQPPQSDPMSRLDPEDLAYITKICSADFRPAEFGDADVLRMALYQSFLEKGFTRKQAAVIVGMTINRVGPIDQ